MLKPGATSTRAPRGSKPVSQAFFTALESIPEASRAAVAKAAQAMIRDEIKARREKVKAAAAKDQARSPATPPRAKKPAATQKNGVPSKAAPKRASRT